MYFGKVPGQPNTAATPVPCSNPLVAGDLCPINVARTLTCTPSVLNSFLLNIGVLEKYINYSFQVTAWTAAGEGPRSTAVFSYTDEDVPEGAVQDLTVVANQVFTITATWSPPLLVLQDGDPRL